MKTLRPAVDKEAALILINNGTEKFEHIENVISYTTRWHIHRDVVFRVRADGSLWGFGYSVGSTEMQDTHSIREMSEDELLDVYPVEEYTKVCYRPKEESE